MASPSSDIRADFKTAVKQEEWYLHRLYPNPEDIPSCTNALDTYFACNTMRNLVKSMYRYGTLREDCSEKWAEYKFCLSLKWMEHDERRDAWIRRKAIWWAKRRLGKSSEDVWQVRDEPLAHFPKAVDTAEYLKERPLEWMSCREN
ncbi:hypothetical protein HMN09_00768200 [Mycena chlorophos]|uniref:Uncharacterized protein n=2 Tax=Mycena chlorophos TaxID=658473 RepID=A0ABQ0M0D0_MYCCL|nr:hypothetical protein HMN09_00768200 [Mycena chlorophos]GAT56776.1 predicted protein [Mycena chlorophos]